MADFSQIAELFVDSLGLGSTPVAIFFSDQPLSDLQQRSSTQPSGCSYWKLAAEGKTCHTAPEDHYNCAIGSHTHNISLPADRADELGKTLGLMAENQYLSMDEVPLIPQLKTTPASISYVPLAEAEAAPDVVLICGSSRSVMLLQEAAMKAGIEVNGSLMGRPTCMALPAAMQGGLTTSLGCVGNRVYTQIADGDLYVALPGAALNAIAEALPIIANANQILGDWHQNRRKALTTQVTVQS